MSKGLILISPLPTKISFFDVKDRNIVEEFGKGMKDQGYEEIDIKEDSPPKGLTIYEITAKSPSKLTEEESRDNILELCKKHLPECNRIYSESKVE